MFDGSDKNEPGGGKWSVIKETTAVEQKYMMILYFKLM